MNQIIDSACIVATNTPTSRAHVWPDITANPGCHHNDGPR